MDVFGCTRSKPSEGSLLAGRAPVSYFSFCFQCKMGSSLVLSQPSEITALVRTRRRFLLPDHKPVVYTLGVLSLFFKLYDRIERARLGQLLRRGLPSSEALKQVYLELFLAQLFLSLL